MGSTRAAFLGRQLVTLVNPRLGLYTRAGLLAAIILALNYAFVALLSIILMQSCTATTLTEKSRPVTQSPWTGQAATTGHIRLVNETITRQGTHASADGSVSVTTNATLCAESTFALVGVPFPTMEYLRAPTNVGGFGLPAGTGAAYEGTTVQVELPCWSAHQACETGETWNGNHQDYRRDNMPCVAQNTELYAGELYQKFVITVKWCSAEHRLTAIDRFLALRDVESTLHPGSKVNLGTFCSQTFFVAPGGVLGKLYDGSRSSHFADGYPGAIATTYTQNWQLEVTTTTTTCPTFWQAFANAFAFCAQIEVIVTILLVFLCKKGGCIVLREDLVDLGAHGIVDSKVLSGAKGSQGQTAVDPAAAVLAAADTTAAAPSPASASAPATLAA